jgi:hypothetical protein
MKPEEINQVLMEIFDELKTLKEQEEKRSKTLEDLSQVVKSFDEKLSTMKVTALPTDLTPVEQQLAKGINNLQAILESRPKNIIRYFNFHFFPKLNIKEYYRTYSKLVLYLTIIVLVAGLVNIGVEWIQGYNRRHELPSYHGIENYGETTIKPEVKSGKRKTGVFARDSVTRKRHPIVPSNLRDTVSKKLLMDSLKKRIEEHLFRHSADTAN